MSSTAHKIFIKDGSPMQFWIPPGTLRKTYKKVIEEHGGSVVKHCHYAKALRLVRSDSKEKGVSVNFIDDCLKHSQLLSPSDYRLPKDKKLKRSPFKPEDHYIIFSELFSKVNEDKAFTLTAKEWSTLGSKLSPSRRGDTVRSHFTHTLRPNFLILLSKKEVSIKYNDESFCKFIMSKDGELKMIAASAIEKMLKRAQEKLQRNKDFAVSSPLKLTGRVVTLEEGTPAESPIQEWGIAERDNKEETPARKREFRKRQAQKEDQIERPNTLSDISAHSEQEKLNFMEAQVRFLAQKYQQALCLVFYCLYYTNWDYHSAECLLQDKRPDRIVWNDSLDKLFSEQDPAVFQKLYQLCGDREVEERFAFLNK